jgi:Protein of unknown function DUF2834
MTTSLVFYGILGIVSTVVAFVGNRRLFAGGPAGRVSPLEGVYYLVGLCSLVLGWYFNVRYVHLYGSRASYVDYVKMLFTNWAADSAAQDYTIVNLVLMPLWTITDGRRRGLRLPWIFFVMSLFTSLAFAIAMFLAFMERQIRYNRAAEVASTASSTAYPQL